MHVNQKDSKSSDNNNRKVDTFKEDMEEMDNQDVNKILRVSFSDTFAECNPDQHEDLKRKILDEQTTLYNQLQCDKSTKVTAFKPQPAYTMTQWIRETKKQRRIEAAKEEELLQIQQSKETEVLVSSEKSAMKTPEKTSEEVSTTKTAPVTLEKCHEEMYKENKKCHKTSPYHKADDDDSEKVAICCEYCLDPMDLCHEKQFSAYCMVALDLQFRATPLDMSRKRCNKVFTAAYNRARDFNLFLQNNNVLPAKGYYLTPACLKNRLRECIDDIESEQNDHISKKSAFVTAAEFEQASTIETPTQVIDENTQSLCDSEALCDKLYGSQSICKHCGCTPETCHRTIFSEYCVANVIRI